MGSWWQLFEDEFYRAQEELRDDFMNMIEGQESHELTSWFANLSMSTKRLIKEKWKDMTEPYRNAVVDPLFNADVAVSFSQIAEEIRATAKNATDYIGDETELKLSKKEPEMNSEQRERVSRAIMVKQWIQSDGLEAVMKAVFMGVSAAYGEGDYEADRDRKYSRVLENLMSARWNSEGL